MKFQIQNNLINLKNILHNQKKFQPKKEKETAIHPWQLKVQLIHQMTDLQGDLKLKQKMPKKRKKMRLNYNKKNFSQKHKKKKLKEKKLNQNKIK